MGFADANRLLSGPREPIAKFDAIGDTITGTLLDAEIAPITAPDGTVQTDKNGNPKQQIIYTLQTDESDPEIDDDDGKRRVYAKWAIQKAISECLTNMGLANVGLKEGGKLTITHSSTQKASQKGYSDIKLYTAEYEPPAAKKLPSDTKEAVPTKSTMSVANATKYTDDQIQMAYRIHHDAPDSGFAVIAAATGIAVEDLEQIIPF